MNNYYPGTCIEILDSDVRKENKLTAFINESSNLNSQKFLVPLQYEFMDSLTDIEYDTLIAYRNDFYEFINKDMLIDSDETIVERNIILGIFERVPPIETQIIVYRGWSNFDTPKSIINQKCFMSTTLDIGTAVNFSNEYGIVYKIILPPGTKILPLNYLYKSNENEGTVITTFTCEKDDDDVIICNSVFINSQSVIVEN